MDTVSSIVTELAWPLVALVAIVLFRTPLGALLGRLMSLSLVAGKFELKTTMKGHESNRVLSEMDKGAGLALTRVEVLPVTIVRCYTRGYTSFEEKLSPDEVGEYLHEYLTSMTEVVFELGGTLDKYEGTALTAYWGAPIAYTDAAERACAATLRMQDVVSKLSPWIEQRGFPPLLPMFAITSTTVLVGNLGSAQRFNYSILGDFDNTLDELVRFNQNFQTNILLTEYTYKEIGDSFETGIQAKDLRVNGKDSPIAVYELLGRSSDLTPASTAVQ